MKQLLFVILYLIIPYLTLAQDFCFHNPNTGPHYHNGSSGSTYDLCYGDFNGDGTIDIITANSIASNISFIPIGRDGSLGDPDTFYLASSTVFCISTADFNNDTHLDLAVGTSGEIIILTGNGQGSFQITARYPAGHPSRIYATDMDQDGYIDLVETTTSGIYFLKGQAAGSFQSPELLSTGGEVIDVAIGDFDGDSLNDLVATTHIDIVTSELSFLKGNGNGKFEAAIATAVPDDRSIFGIRALDLNLDSVLDLVVSNHNTAFHRIEVYNGKGDGTFEAPVFFTTKHNPNYVYLADMDGDGSDDVVVLENSGFSVLRNNNNGTLGPYQYFVATPTPNSAAIADFDLDGRLDVIVPTAYQWSGIIVVNLNCGSISGNESAYSPDFKLSPNPVNSILTISSSAIIKTLTIYDMMGRDLYQRHYNSSDVMLDISMLESGQYVVKIIYETGASASSLIIKVR